MTPCHCSSYQNINIRSLYPGREGAGYTGGILSAAVDGIRIAEAVAMDLPGIARNGSQAD